MPRKGTIKTIFPSREAPASGRGASLSNRLERHVGRPILAHVPCEGADKVESDDPLETKHHRLYREYSNFMNRLPKRTDIFKGMRNENCKIIKPWGKTCQAP